VREQMTCGNELAGNAVLPATLGELAAARSNLLERRSRRLVSMRV
jgi:hypothetical protein